MRLLFRSFVLLDCVSLVLMSMQLWNTAIDFDKLPDQLSVKVQAVLMFPMFVLVLIAAIGQFQLKKFGFILYYIQFPFRLYLWVFTLGFITLVPMALGMYNDDAWFDPMLKICFMAEFIRLYLTVKGQINLKKKTDRNNLPIKA